MLNGRESLSDAARTWIEPAPALFGSFTVTVTDSSQSTRFVRSTEIVAHCPPAGWPDPPKRWQAGWWAGTNCDSSTG